MQTKNMERKNRSHLTCSYVSCVFSILVIICTQSLIVFADGSGKYNYYALSPRENAVRIVVKANKHHLPLDVNYLQGLLGSEVTSISAHEVTSSDRLFEVNGGIMSTSLDGSREQRAHLESTSIFNVLDDAISLHSSSLPRQIDGPEEWAGNILRVDFPFQGSRGLGAMMDNIHRALFGLQRANHIAGYRIQRIEYSAAGRYGVLIIDVMSSVSGPVFSEFLGRSYAGYFILPGPDTSDTSVRDRLDQVRHGMATNHSVRVYSALTDLRLREESIAASSQRSTAEGERGSTGNSALYLYQVEAIPENEEANEEANNEVIPESRPANTPYFVLSRLSGLQENSGQLPFRFTLITNQRRFASGIPINHRHLVVLSERGSVEGDEMPILYQLLVQRQTFQSSCPSDSDRPNYTTYAYYLYFDQNDSEPVNDFVSRVVGSLNSLRRGEYYDCAVSGVYPNNSGRQTLRFSYIRYVRMEPRQDDENRRFLERARDNNSVNQAYLYRLLSLTPRPSEDNQNAGVWRTILRWLARSCGGRVLVQRAAATPAQDLELVNVVVPDPPDEQPQHSVERVHPDVRQALLKNSNP